MGSDPVNGGVPVDTNLLNSLNVLCAKLNNVLFVNVDNGV